MTVVVFHSVLGYCETVIWQKLEQTRTLAGISHPCFTGAVIGSSLSRGHSALSIFYW